MRTLGFRLNYLILAAVLISPVSAALSADLPSSPEDFRKTPNATFWINRVSNAEDKVSAWIEAAGKGDAYTKWIAATELGELHDMRAMPVLKKLTREPIVYTRKLPHYQSVAYEAIEITEAHDYIEKNVESKPTNEEKLKAARRALHDKNLWTMRRAVRYLKEHETPQSAVQTLIAEGLAGEADNIIGEHISEGWVVDYAKKIVAIKVPSFAIIEYQFGINSRSLLTRMETEELWKSLFGEPKTPEEIKAAALKVLANKGELRPRAIDYIIDLDDPDLLPVWIDNMDIDSRVFDKVVKMGRPVVPELIERLKQLDKPRTIQYAIGALREIKDPQSIEPIADVLFAKFPEEHKWGGCSAQSWARDALVAFGKQSTPAVIRVLNSDDSRTVYVALNAMDQIHDRSVIPALLKRKTHERAKNNPDKDLIRSIDMSIDSIARGVH